MKRETLIQHEEVTVTSDTAQSLSRLQEKVEAKGWALELKPSNRECSEHFSMEKGGREVHLAIRAVQAESETHLIHLLWHIAIPLGFTPLDRYPTPSVTQGVFQFFGPWKPMYDRIMAEGMGHLAYLAVCCAAQSDVGVWKGSRNTERFVQSQLNRLGHHCGQVDGVIGPRTKRSIEVAGLSKIALKSIGKKLAEQSPRKPSKGEFSKGNITIPNRHIAVSSFGNIQSIQGNQGVELNIQGEGRVVVDIGAVG